MTGFNADIWSVRGFNADRWRIRIDCVAFQMSRSLYKQLPLFDDLCHTPLPTFYLFLTVLEFVHDEALGFDRHYTVVVW